jgi:hypothetical protein
MDKCIIISEEVRATFTAHAALAGLGRLMQVKKVFEPIVKQVEISQKVVKYTPSEKLLDAQDRQICRLENRIRQSQSIYYPCRVHNQQIPGPKKISPGYKE